MSSAAVLCGVGAYLPPRLVTNDDLALRMDTSDEWIRSRTGIGRRHFADPGTATSDLAVEAGARALKSAGRDGADAVVVATMTPDHPCPATAPTVASRLGLTGATAFDVSAVCSGFVYALATAAGLIATGVARSVLVIGAEVNSTVLNPDDRSTSVIFGDGAGAVLLRAGTDDEYGALGPFDLGSDGTGAEHIMIAAGGSRGRGSGAEPAPGDQYMAMHGQEVFRHAVLRMSASARHVLAQAGWGVPDLDRVVSHQANQRIINQLADDLGLPRDRAVGNIARVGNTGAASIPIALADACSRGELNEGDRVLLTAFGGGLTWGSTLLRWPRVDGV
ncbi:3-oxoacyl-[acyl-carrier-protein] synthase III [Nocardiopsis sp. Huas11]|uniref:beta-ketoacyl-ACP synthase III n=1 Tax=Nocardiopsis sp. Huas11 TaxID=2183912 RepID=UPI000EAFC1A0|nr:beta-ketoacyl-ACP synthase III [Nocardiopsis sp. Huas11]RKS09672.1 3-oxoacyl-[acyl-carrier-protein] synthase III [Nocardiopsis sp. Huas11]